MTIIHICLCPYYVEGMGYQENIIPKMHRLTGNDVYLLTSDYSFNSKGEAVKKQQRDYISDGGFRVIVLDRSKKHGYFSRFGEYDGVSEWLTKLKPDVIFVHGGYFLSIYAVTRYCKENRQVRLYIDQHGDYYNSPVNTFREKIIKKVLYRHFMHKPLPYVKKYWGVTPWRCQYLKEIYKIPEQKIGLLVMGGDDGKINFSAMPELREKIRKDLNISKDDFVVITGGKLDRAKNIHLLMKAASELDSDKIKLIVFGQPNDDMQAEIEELSKDTHIINIGWITADSAYDYFLASDLAVFPGTHSVLWEQACACGLPCVFKDWEGMHHVDVGGNCVFLTKDSAEEMKCVITAIQSDGERYKRMKKAAEKGIKEFSYRDISRRAIEAD